MGLAITEREKRVRGKTVAYLGGCLGSLGANHSYQGGQIEQIRYKIPFLNNAQTYGYVPGHIDG